MTEPPTLRGSSSMVSSMTRFWSLVNRFLSSTVAGVSLVSWVVFTFDEDAERLQQKGLPTEKARRGGRAFE